MTNQYSKGLHNNIIKCSTIFCAVGQYGLCVTLASGRQAGGNLHSPDQGSSQTIDMKHNCV